MSAILICELTEKDCFCRTERQKFGSESNLVLSPDGADKQITSLRSIFNNIEG